MWIFVVLVGIGFAYLYIKYIKYSEEDSKQLQQNITKSYADLHIESSTRMYVAQSKIPHAGRGVFAKEQIKKGELIETCPVIGFPPNESYLLSRTRLKNHFFGWGRAQEDSALCLGFGSLYNHSSTPNAIWGVLPEKNIIQFFALRDITKDEEITHDYHWNPRTRGENTVDNF